MEWLLYIGGGLAAFGVIIAFLRRLAKVITAIETLLPLLKKLNEVFAGDPNVFDFLREIRAQFRTDSGSSLRDIVNRLESLAEENKISIDEVRVDENLRKIGEEASKQLAKMDREDRLQLILKLDRLSVSVAANSATGDRIEKAAGVVADNLAHAHERAQDADSQPGAGAGAAADAAVLTTGKDSN